jgi:uncharacterized RDD family membrane protein YckC
MRRISIRTAQNVSIDFQVAGLAPRILAYTIDVVIMGTIMMILAFILLWINEILIYGVLSVFLFYTLVSELAMHGQTFGKKAMRIRVVSVNGSEPAPLDYVIRWAFRMVDIYFSIGSLAVIFISTSARAQRLGGILSNSMVVSLQSEIDLNLSDILRIDDRSSYVPVYTNAYRFSEEEMLTVKNLLERYEKYQNQAHRQLIDMATRKCADVLGLATTPADKRNFLKTVIRDYIVITRS